nr:glycoside hydrolase family 2 [Pedobacter panaciterrae]
MKRIIFSALCLVGIFSVKAMAQQSKLVYLSGTDKDNTVNWDFFCTKGMNSGKWTEIPVPSQWELQGFGGYNYGHDKKKWDEQGLYLHHFKADKSWSDKEIQLVFEGVMTDAEVKINGQLAGAIHQGSFYRFNYPVSSLLKFDADNVLEVTVSKESADPTVNKAERQGDFWALGGIFRPVYLRIMPKTFIDRVAIDAKADGGFGIDVFTGKVQSGDKVSVRLKTLKGAAFGAPINYNVTKPADSIRLTGKFTKPALWNPEFPNLYTAEVSITRNGRIVNVLNQRFGFRTVEVRKSDGIYVNGTKILVKGVNRHSFWPESGRTLSRKVHLQDIMLMKDMNMNAVRMSHYPPDAEFLDLCDSIGLFVVDELTGWQQHYGTPVGRKLVKELIVRDVNHPSIMFWANGNEGGFNLELDNDYALYDPQKRVVIHPWSNFNNIDTKHYPEYKYIENAANKQDILLHTEMIHGLYDGGHGASLDDNWKLIRQNPRHAGGFLWALTDEGVVRRDKKDSIDTDGNHGADGIVGPHREKEGSFYTIKEVWSPVQAKRPDFTAQNVVVELENTYLYTNLSDCNFTWQLVKFPLATEKKNGFTQISSGKLSAALAPGKTGSFKLGLTPNWKDADALRFIATNKQGREIYTWTWPIKTTAQIVQKNLEALDKEKSKISDSEKESAYVVVQNGITYTFDTQTGYLKTVENSKGVVSFGNGPALAGVNQALQSFKHVKTADGGIIVESSYSGESTLNAKWLFVSGKPVCLEYDYTQTGTANFYGITFNIDESKITGMRWLGDGPYRTWKNRLKGVSTSVWEKSYNNTITGETFVYPEFKGYHANLYWAEIEAGNSTFKVYTDKSNLFLQMLKPEKQHTSFISHVNPPFPEGNLGFLDAIAPIGNKFKQADSMGPQSQKNVASNSKVSGKLWFDFY